MKRVLVCSLFWMFLFQFLCYRLMGRYLGDDGVLFVATYAFSMLLPIVGLLYERPHRLPLPALLAFSGLLTFFSVGGVWYFVGWGFLLMYHR